MIKSSSMGEIARIAGVSISTVSRVLNEKPGISPE
ncbi:MAG: LacI family transcriptional regulator, partial [Bacteroidetes bacterium]